MLLAASEGRCATAQGRSDQRDPYNCGWHRLINNRCLWPGFEPATRRPFSAPASHFVPVNSLLLSAGHQSTSWRMRTLSRLGRLWAGVDTPRALEAGLVSGRLIAEDILAHQLLAL